MNIISQNQYRGFTILSSIRLLCCLLLISFVTLSCEEEDLPEEGSIPDLTPPSASFAFSASDGDYRTVSFSNQSVSATDYSWDFGDGTTSTEINPSHTYSADGTYSVSLTSTDKLNQTSTTVQDVDIVEPVSNFVPEILNPGFDIEGEDSYRDNWRNGDLGGVLQITSSPVHEGEKAAKFPSAGDRIAYQLITVEKEKDYILSFYYTLKTSPVGTLTVSILGGAVSDPAQLGDATIASVDCTDQSSSSTYVLQQLSFNSGSNTEVAIFISNVGVEGRVDTFTIIED